MAQKTRPEWKNARIQCEPVVDEFIEVPFGSSVTPM